MQIPRQGRLKIREATDGKLISSLQHTSSLPCYHQHTTQNPQEGCYTGAVHSRNIYYRGSSHSVQYDSISQQPAGFSESNHMVHHRRKPWDNHNLYTYARAFGALLLGQIEA